MTESAEHAPAPSPSEGEGWGEGGQRDKYLSAEFLGGSVLRAFLLLGCLLPLWAMAEPAPIFVDRTTALGVNFHHQSGKSGELYYVEMMGAGGALFDYDNDGDLDLYLVQGNQLGKPPDPALRDRLYRNDLVVSSTGARNQKLVDVTDEVGLVASGYGMGVATGDYNNDGWIDLYVTNFGRNQLWRNDGAEDGAVTFTEVTEVSGTGDASWSIAASFVDLDLDGWLDLYVGNYVDFVVTDNKYCPAPTGGRDYCGPLAYNPLPDRLFLNRGASGKFEELAARAGLTGAASGMGVVSGDYDGNGWPDLYVTNDAMANQLWLNQGKGQAAEIKFLDDALLAGCAFNLEGQPEASMGVAAGDVDGDGFEDLFVTHLIRETNTLYLNRGKGQEAAFLDTTLKSGLGTPSWLYTGFGVALFDYDNDGRLDALVANGAVRLFDRDILEVEPAKVEPGAKAEPGIKAKPDASRTLDQPNQLFHNLGGGRFDEVTAMAGEAFKVSEISRGVSFGDLDNDGDIDAVIHNNHGPVRILINQIGDAAGWLGVRLVGGAGRRRDMLGAEAWLREAPRPVRRRLRSDGSYASASDPRIVFGLAGSPEPKTVRVRWPGGRVEDFQDVQPGRYTVLEAGRGQAPRAEEKQP